MSCRGHQRSVTRGLKNGVLSAARVLRKAPSLSGSAPIEARRGEGGVWACAAATPRDESAACVRALPVLPVPVAPAGAGAGPRAQDHASTMAFLKCHLQLRIQGRAPHQVTAGRYTSQRRSTPRDRSRYGQRLHTTPQRYSATPLEPWPWRTSARAHAVTLSRRQQTRRRCSCAACACAVACAHTGTLLQLSKMRVSSRTRPGDPLLERAG